ncbi:pre-rRNA-processing protein esf1 [Balamuthia mandrillaris]
MGKQSKRRNNSKNSNPQSQKQNAEKKNNNTVAAAPKEKQQRQGSSNQNNRKEEEKRSHSSSAAMDPRWRPSSKQAHKVEIDERFAKMFTDPHFATQTLDPFGRAKKHTLKEDLHKFYRLPEEEEEDKAKHEEEAEEDSEEASEEQEEEQEEEEEKTMKKQPQATKKQQLKKAAVVEESSEEEEEEDSDEEEEEEEEEQQKEVSEKEEDIPDGEETRRFAVLKCDWEKVTATDLLVLFHSFLPATGVISSVTIYPSQFGKEREQKELQYGPQGVWKDEKKDSDSEEEAENGGEGQSAIDLEKLRRYELDKLKYYFAVVECDSAQTALSIYQQCDGMEFERTGNILDLRFIPDDITFEDIPKDKAADVPSNYQAPQFCSKVLQHTKVELTWDSNDHNREELFMHRAPKFAKDKEAFAQLRDDDFKAYIASSSSEDESDEEERDDWVEVSDDDEEGKKKLKASKRQRYLSLLNLVSPNKEGDEEEEEEEMEITFSTGLSEKVQDLVDTKKQKLKEKERDDDEGESVWQQHLRAQKEKKKQRKKELKEKLRAEKEEQESLRSRREQKSMDEEEEKQQKANLELLVMDEKLSSRRRKDEDRDEEDEDDESTNKNKKGSKKKKGTKKDKKAASFEVDLEDERFSQILTDHRFAIDPTRATKVTPNMLKIQQERSKLHQNGTKAAKNQNGTKQAPRTKTGAAPSSSGNFKDQQLSSLVQSVKRKASALAPPKKEDKQQQQQHPKQGNKGKATPLQKRQKV